MTHDDATMKTRPQETTSAYSVDIKSPLTANNPVDVEEGLFDVQAEVSGPTAALNVYAEAYQGSPPAAPSEALSNSTGDLYDGHIGGFCSDHTPYEQFRILVVAEFESPSGPEGDPIEASDDKGVYEGRCVMG